jgi:hypothetical protein
MITINNAINNNIGNIINIILTHINQDKFLWTIALLITSRLLINLIVTAIANSAHASNINTPSQLLGKLIRIIIEPIIIVFIPNIINPIR